MNSIKNKKYIVKADMSDFKLIEETLTLKEENQILIKIEKFAFTANNITYGVLGKLYRYFEFFPTKEEGYGVINVWGIGTVVGSRNKNIQVGEKIYGYFPMSSYTIFTPDKIQANSGFTVNRDHLPSEYGVYHSYNFLKFDVVSHNLTTEQENLMIIYRPLFLTSFLLDDFLEQTNTSAQIIISSASSKTAYSLAYLLKSRKAKAKIIALTSPKNQNYVKKLQTYDQIVLYNSLSSILLTNSTYIDVSGDPQLLERLSQHLGQSFNQTITVGLSHWDAFTNAKNNPLSNSSANSSKNQVFFAPAWYQKRHNELGVEYANRMRVAMSGCIRESQEWTKLVYGYGPEKIKQIYEKLLKGNTLPEDGFICSFFDVQSKI